MGIDGSPTRYYFFAVRGINRLLNRRFKEVYDYAAVVVYHCVRRGSGNDGEYGYFDAHHQHSVVRKDRCEDQRESGRRKSEGRLLTRSLFFFRAQNNALNRSCNEGGDL